MMVTSVDQHLLSSGRQSGLGWRLTDVFVSEFVSESNTLRLMLDGLPVHDGMLELFYYRLVDGIALRTPFGQLVWLPF